MIWLVIADASGCKIYEYEKNSKNVNPIKELYHPASKLKNSDIVSDGPGHYKTSGATKGSYQPREEPKELEFEKFARQIAKELVLDKNNHQFDTLILISPPHMSGLINGHFDNNFKDCILHDIKKDFTHIKEHEMFAAVHEEIEYRRNHAKPR